MERAASPKERAEMRQTAIQLLFDQRLASIRADSSAYFPDDLRNNHQIPFRVVYRHMSEMLGVAVQYPSTSEMQEMCDEAVAAAEKRRDWVISTKKELAEEDWEISLLSSPEKIGPLFGKTVIFLTGRCGAGKSTLIRKFRSALAEHQLLTINRKGFGYKALAEVDEIDPDEFLSGKEWVGEVPIELINPTMRRALDKLRWALKKVGLIIITDAGDNQGQREAMIRLIDEVRPDCHLHYVLVDCPSLEALARNKARKRNVSLENWLECSNKVDDTFPAMSQYVKSLNENKSTQGSLSSGTWEIVDAGSSLYRRLEEELYQCAHISPFGIRCPQQSIPRDLGCCERLFLPKMDYLTSPYHAGFFCADHFPKRKWHRDK